MFYTFKSQTDAQRHMRIAHDKNFNPMGFTCNFIVDGVKYGQVFEKEWGLNKHKRALGHKIIRKKK